MRIKSEITNNVIEISNSFEETFQPYYRMYDTYHWLGFYIWLIDSKPHYFTNYYSNEIKNFYKKQILIKRKN
jgi:hypothetical protein